MYDFFYSIFLAIIEGVTEFIPVSSTGHLILANEWLGNLNGNSEFTKLFDIVIQFGALLSVIVIYFTRLKPTTNENKKTLGAIIIGVIPSLIVGFFLKDYINILFSPLVVASALVIGGCVMLFPIEKYVRPIHTSITYKTSFIIGLFQCLALIPGTSRSFASIYGGLVQGIERKEATEFSFFLAIPTLLAASVYSLFTWGGSLTAHEINVLVVGFIVSFIIARIIITWFVRYVSEHNFFVFGVYRIILGAIILTLFYFLK